MRILITCPNCQRRYDASRYKIGAKVRCNCGEVMRIRQPQGHDAAIVRCSGCGGPREKGLDHCEFCSSDFTLHERDLHTVCPQCLARVSDRSRFCHACGDRLVAEAVAGEELSLACPACGETHKLMSRRLGKERISVAECQRCAGLWISQASFVQLRDRVARNAVPVQSLFPPKPAVQRDQQPSSRYRRCVQCPQLMNRRQYAVGSGVIVDVCREHGIWFDDQELAQIVDWIARGGQCAGRLDPTEQPKVEQPPVRHRQGKTFIRQKAVARQSEGPNPAEIQAAVFDVVESVLAPLARLSQVFNGKPPSQDR